MSDMKQTNLFIPGKDCTEEVTQILGSFITGCVLVELLSEFLS